MSAFVSSCRYNPTLGGTTDWTFSSAVVGYNSPALAGVVNATKYSYRAESADLTQWEEGTGNYTTGTGVLARTAVLYNSSGTGTGPGQSGAGTKISFSTVPQVAIVALAEDLPSLSEANTFLGTITAPFLRIFNALPIVGLYNAAGTLWARFFHDGNDAYIENVLNGAFFVKLFSTVTHQLSPGFFKIFGTISGSATITTLPAAGTPTLTLPTVSGIFALTNSLQGRISGLTLSTAGSSATFGISAGIAADGAFTDLMLLSSAYTKTTSTWALGTAAGGMDTGTVANSTWYHVHLIKRPDIGTVDVLFSLSATAPTMPTNYTLFRRIGSMKTNGSAQWTKFIQDGDLFRWDVPVADFNVANPGTAAVSRTLTVPTGINAIAHIRGRSSTVTAASATATLYSDLAVADTTPDFVGNAQAIANTSLGPVVTMQVRCNTSAQIRVRSSFSDANVNIYCVTEGWNDTRGK